MRITGLAGYGLAALVLFWGPGVCRAGSEEIVTDRPDFVESSLSVGKGRFQVETSVNLERDATDGVKTRIWSTPTLLRYGFADDWEVRLETEGFTWARTEDPSSGTSRIHGFQDVEIGMKWHMRDQAGVLPSTAWLLHAAVDSGSREFRGDGVRPSLRATMEWELGGEFGLGVMPGIAFDKDESGDRYMAGILGVVLGYEPAEGSRVFVEVAGRQLASQQHGGNVITYDIGASHLLGKSVQIDTALSFGANDDTPDFGWTLGLSMKF